LMMRFLVMFMMTLSVDELRDATVTQAQELQSERQTDDERLGQKDHDEGNGDTLNEVLDAFHVYIIAPPQGYTRVIPK